MLLFFNKLPTLHIYVLAVHDADVTVRNAVRSAHGVVQGGAELHAGGQGAAVSIAVPVAVRQAARVVAVVVRVAVVAAVVRLPVVNYHHPLVLRQHRAHCRYKRSCMHSCRMYLKRC